LEFIGMDGNTGQSVQKHFGRTDRRSIIDTDGPILANCLN
jgi:hypothetical protein